MSSQESILFGMSADSPRVDGDWRASFNSKCESIWERPESVDSPAFSSFNRKSYDIGTLTRELVNKETVVHMLADENRSLKQYVELLRHSIQELGGEVHISHPKAVNLHWFVTEWYRADTHTHTHTHLPQVPEQVSRNDEDEDDEAPQKLPPGRSDVNGSVDGVCDTSMTPSAPARPPLNISTLAAPVVSYSPLGVCSMILPALYSDFVRGAELTSERLLSLFPCGRMRMLLLSSLVLYRKKQSWRNASSVGTSQSSRAGCRKGRLQRPIWCLFRPHRKVEGAGS